MGKGTADVAFIPMPLSGLPALVVELKWNRTAGGAISQIKNKNYTPKLKTLREISSLLGLTKTKRLVSIRV